MRLLFLSLLLANALFFAWQFWLAPEEPATRLRTAQNAPRLLLASERPADETDAAASSKPQPVTATAVGAPEDDSPGEGVGTAQPESAAVTQLDDEGSASADAAESAPADDAEALLLAALEPQPATMCVSVGPFRDLADATTAGAQLAERGLAPRQRSGEGVVWQGFWVYLPAYPDRKAAQAGLDRLKASGVSEAYIVPTGDDRNAIALGLLSERGRAERLAGQVGRLGFKPQIAERNRTDTVYWVDVEVEDAGAIDPLQFQTSPDRIARLRVVECPAAPAR